MKKSCLSQVTRIFFLTTFVACTSTDFSQDPSSIDAVTPGDVSNSVDAIVPQETSPDTKADGTPDSTFDSQVDVFVDVAFDVKQETTSDAVADVTLDTRPDSPPDMMADVVSDSSPDVLADAAETGPVCPMPTVPTKTYDYTKIECYKLAPLYRDTITKARSCGCGADCSKPMMDSVVCGCQIYANPGKEEVNMAVAMFKEYELRCKTGPDICPTIFCPSAQPGNCGKPVLGGSLICLSANGGS